MASSKSISAQVPRYRHTLTVSVIRTDEAANTSRVKFQYWVESLTTLANGSWTALNDVTFNVAIAGVGHSAAPNFDFRDYTRFLAIEGEQTLTHTDDGTLTATIAFSCNENPGSVYFLAVSASDSMALDDLSRASTFTMTPGSVIEGGSVTIDITRYDAGFTHDITWVSGASSGTIGTGVGTTTTWTPDPGLLGGDARVPITISVQTKGGATNIGAPVVKDLLFLATPDYPEVGVGTPYDIRLRRTEMDGSDWVIKEPIPFLTATITDTFSASGTCTFTVARSIYDTDLDDSVVVSDIFDGSQWLPKPQAFYLSRTESDDTDLTDVVTYTGTSYADYILSKGIVMADADWPITSPGDILRGYIDGSQDRGWGPKLHRSFSPSATSIGTLWANSTGLKTTTNTPFSQILAGFVSDFVVEYSSFFDTSAGKVTLEAFNPGHGVDWASLGSFPIVNFATQGVNRVVDKAPVRKDFSDKLTRVRVAGDEAAVTRESGGAVNPMFGHLEGSVSATGVSDKDQLNKLGDAVLTVNATATVERTYSYDLSSTQTPDSLYPYRTFRPGDWVLIPVEAGLEKVRVSQVAITRTDAGTTATITVGDMLPSGVSAIARKLAQQSAGSIAGGTLRAPLTLSSAIPAAPTGISLTPIGYWDTSGAPRAGIEVSWSPVVTSLAGSDIAVDLYEIWQRQEAGTPWSLALLSDDTTATVSDLPINTPVDFRIRARSVAGIYGAYSDIYSDTTPEPSVDLDGPVMTDLYTDGVGSIYAVWAGVLGTDPAPLRLAYVVAEVSDDGGATYTTMGTPITAAGAIVINPGSWGDFTVRLRGYDRLGNSGDASTPDAVTLTDPHVNPARPEAPTSLASTPGAAWDAAGVSDTAWFDLTWDAPTLDTDGNAITIAGYDLWGKRDTETELRFLTSSATNAVRWFVEADETWGFQVRAVSQFGGVSGFSTAIIDTADETIDAPDAPDAPTLSQYAGLLRIQWSGNGMVPHVKYVFASIATSISGTYVRAGMPLQGAGEVVVPGLATDQDYYAKINLVDERGQIVSSVAAGPEYLLPITGVTIQTSEVANTGIKINSGSLTAYDAMGAPTFILDAGTGEVWIAPYDAVFELGASGTEAETGDPTTGLAISSDDASFNTFIHPSGIQIRNDQTPLSWWEADESDSNLINLFAPRVVVGSRMRIGDLAGTTEAKSGGASRFVFRYVGA